MPTRKFRLLFFLIFYSTCDYVKPSGSFINNPQLDKNQLNTNQTPTPKNTPDITPTPSSTSTDIPHKIQCNLNQIQWGDECFSLATNNALLIEPKENQVFQRRTRTTGNIYITLSLQPGFSQIKVIISNPDSSIIYSQTFTAPNQPFFTTSIPLPAEKTWRNIIVQQSNISQKTVIQSQVNKVGIGDVFVIAGQSNSANYGAIQQTPQSSFYNAFNFISSTWQIANDPQPGYGPPSIGINDKGSTWPPMSDELYNQYNYSVPLATMMTSFGGTSISQWILSSSIDPNISSCTNLITGGITLTTIQAMNNGFYRLFYMSAALIRFTRGIRMILWHQGESDALYLTPGNTYRQNFLKMQSDLDFCLQKEFANPNLRVNWSIAIASYAQRTISSATNEIAFAQILLVNPNQHRFSGANTNVLIGNVCNTNPAGAGVACRAEDDTHFSDAGLKAAGKDWAAKVSLIDKNDANFSIVTLID